MPSPLRHSILAWTAFASIPVIGVAKYQIIDKPNDDSYKKVVEVENARNNRWINSAPNNTNIKNLNWARTTGREWLKHTRLLEEADLTTLDLIKTPEEQKNFSDTEDYTLNLGFETAAQQQGYPCLTFKNGLQNLERLCVENSSLAQEVLSSGKTDYIYSILPGLDLTGNIVQQVTKEIEDPVQRNIKAAELSAELNNLLRKETKTQGLIKNPLN